MTPYLWFVLALCGVIAAWLVPAVRSRRGGRRPVAPLWLGMLVSAGVVGAWLGDVAGASLGGQVAGFGVVLRHGSAEVGECVVNTDLLGLAVRCSAEVAWDLGGTETRTIRAAEPIRGRVEVAEYETCTSGGRGGGRSCHRRVAPLSEAERPDLRWLRLAGLTVGVGLGLWAAARLPGRPETCSPGR